MAQNKILLNDTCGIILQVGDIIEEVNRFTKDCTIYQITDYNPEEDYMLMSVLKSNTYTTKEVSGCISAHFNPIKSAYLTYYLPNGKVLYGPNT